jgi:hypothetical protein
MADPHLNSMHLDLPRREEFRRAREMLIRSRGQQTQALEHLDEAAWPHGDGNTLVQHFPDRVPPGLDQWLMDQDAIYPLKVGVNTIGRLPDNDVVIKGSYVSRRHCAILVHAGDGCELHDIASKNGTYVNGRRLVGPVHLNSGDEIRMCDRQFIFYSKAGPGNGLHHDRTSSV